MATATYWMSFTIYDGFNAESIAKPLSKITSSFI